MCDGDVVICYLMFNKMNDQQLKEEVHWLVASIKDPEKRECTLEDLGVINSQSVNIHIVTQCGRLIEGEKKDKQAQLEAIRLIEVQLKPTNAHCHLIQQIALAIHLRLKRQLPMFSHFKLRIICFPQSHAKQQEVEKQMNDKQRIAAALQNQHIVDYLNELID